MKDTAVVVSLVPPLWLLTRAKRYAYAFVEAAQRIERLHLLAWLLNAAATRRHASEMQLASPL